MNSHGGNILLTPEVAAFVGFESEEETACDAVERGAVRRFVQASLDDDPLFYDPGRAGWRHGGPIAPPLYPASLFRRDFDTGDPLIERAADANFDGIVGSTAQGLRPLPLPSMALLNGGMEVEILRCVNHGDRVVARSRYDRIYEKNGKSGPMLFVEIVTEYRNEARDLLMTVRKTQIRRPS